MSNLKSLQTQLNRIDQAISETKKTLSEQNANLVELQKQSRLVKNQIQNLTEKKIVVSEHAILRYLERVDGVDIEEIKRKILNPDVVSLMNKLENANGEYPSNKSWRFRLVLKDKIVTTILTK